MLIAFLASAITGVLKFPGFLRDFGFYIWQLPATNISIIHDWAGVVLVVFILLHIIFNFSWIRCVMRLPLKRGSKKVSKRR